MRPKRLLATATFRLTLAYLGVFALSALALLAFVYEASVTFMEQQTRETIAAEARGLEEQYRQRGIVGLRTAITRRARANPDRASLYLLVDADGRWLAGNLDRWPEVEDNGDGTVRFTFTRPGPDGRGERRIATGRVFLVDDRYRLLVGRDVQERADVQHMLINAIVLGGGLVVVIGVLAGFARSRWTLGRLEGINRATRLIMAGDLSRRIQLVGDGDEFDELARNLNLMLDRIEELVRAMREVTDNIAHDLRTPLNRMVSRIELALMGGLDGARARGVLEETLRDAEGLIRTFDALLAITRAESGALEGEHECVELAALARDVAELYEPLAEEKRQRLRVEAEEGVCVEGHPQLLAQALANLVDNAVKYTPEGGEVAVRVRGGPRPVLEVADNGPGIPEADRERARQRFVRLDPGRSTPGNGLGLSLVDAVARLHGAALELDDNRPGLLARLVFPAPSPRRPPARAEAAAG
ncbi:Sensor kinase CusS [bacterium HR39]|nr:Sensor kinase CusS [bacterium HR39]